MTSPWRLTALVLALLAAAGEVRAEEPVPSTDSRKLYALGARGRLFLVRGLLLSSFLQEFQTVTSGSLGFEFTRRTGRVDVVTSLDYTWLSPSDGNFLAAGKDAALDTHYTQFRGLGLLSVDVTFVYHQELARWLEVLVGAGVGLGAMLGDVYVINNSGSVCTRENAGDPLQCHPVAAPGETYVDAQGQTRPIGAIRPDDPDFQRKLDATLESKAACERMNGNGQLDCRDTAMHPHLHVAKEKPPVMVVVNLMFGLRFKVHRHANINLTAGFRNGWFVGMGPEYVF